MLVRMGLKDRVGVKTESASDGVLCSWSSGALALEISDPDSPNNSFIIAYRKLDSFGGLGEDQMVFDLPRDTPVADLAKAMIVSLRFYKRGIPLQSPWRWGLPMSTTTTTVADGLSAHGLAVEEVSRSHVVATAGGPVGPRDLSLSEPPEGGFWRLTVQDSLVPSPATAVRIGHSEAPAFLIAAILSHLQPDAWPFDPRRIGLNGGEFPQIADVARAFDVAGTRPMRFDLDRVRKATGGRYFADVDVLSLIDRHQHLLLLSLGGPRATGTSHWWWRLYGIKLDDSGIAQPTPMVLAKDTDWWWCGDPFSIAVPAVTPEALAWTVGRSCSFDEPILSEVPLEPRILQQPNNIDMLFQMLRSGRASNRRPTQR